MKKILLLTADFLAKLLFLSAVGFYAFCIYIHFTETLYAFDIRILAINFVCVTAILLVWAFAQKMEWRLVPEETKLSKKTSRVFSWLFVISAVLLIFWIIAYYIIFSLINANIKIFGRYIVFNKQLMLATFMFWIAVWLVAVPFSSLKTPARLASGYVLTGLCGSLGNVKQYVQSLDIIDYYFMKRLFLRHLVPLYLGAVLFAASFFILKNICKERGKAVKKAENAEKAI